MVLLSINLHIDTIFYKRRRSYNYTPPAWHIFAIWEKCPRTIFRFLGPEDHRPKSGIYLHLFSLLFPYIFVIGSLYLFFVLYAINIASANPIVPGRRSLALRMIIFTVHRPTCSLKIDAWPQLRLSQSELTFHDFYGVVPHWSWARRLRKWTVKWQKRRRWYGKRGYWLKERVDVRIGYKVHTKFKISLKQFLGQEESWSEFFQGVGLLSNIDGIG